MNYPGRTTATLAAAAASSNTGNGSGSAGSSSKLIKIETGDAAHIKIKWLLLFDEFPARSHVRQLPVHTHTHTRTRPQHNMATISARWTRRRRCRCLSSFWLVLVRWLFAVPSRLAHSLTQSRTVTATATARAHNTRANCVRALSLSPVPGLAFAAGTTVCARVCVCVWTFWFPRLARRQRRSVQIEFSLRALASSSAASSPHSLTDRPN